MEPTKRHRIIKEFQDGLKKDALKLCVATYANAAVGVTLTAANRVFMEPCTDPATELQAAGRIHRLGQTKEVLIKRFAYPNTIEPAIVDRHVEITATRVAGGAANTDPVVQQTFKKHNLHKEVHTSDGTAGRRKFEQRGVFNKRRGTYGTSTWWELDVSRCRCCQRYVTTSKNLGMKEGVDHWRRDDPNMLSMAGSAA